MDDHDRKKPLYRKVNTRARGVHHRAGGDYRHERNSKREKLNQDEAISRGSMHGKKQRGLDYTPLFRFLLSKVGADWVAVRTQAIERLETEEPIYRMVARNDEEKRQYVRLGDNAYYSGLYVDEGGKLAKVDPSLRNEDLTPSCACCTHTFNGVVFLQKYKIPTE
jgi:hypothetical protein